MTLSFFLKTIFIKEKKNFKFSIFILPPKETQSIQKSHWVPSTPTIKLSYLSKITIATITSLLYTTELPKPCPVMPKTIFSSNNICLIIWKWNEIDTKISGILFLNPKEKNPNENKIVATQEKSGARREKFLTIRTRKTKMFFSWCTFMSFFLVY